MISYTIKQSVMILVEIIEFAILIRILISYIDSLRYSRFANIIYQITDPILVPCKRILERLNLGGQIFDFSPILAYILLRIVVYIVVYIF